MPVLRANRTEPLSLTADSLNSGVTFAVDFAGDDGVPYVGANSPTKVGTLPLITTSVGTNSGRDVSNGGASGINQYRWDDATKIGIPSGVADFTFWARLRTPNVANSTPDQKELIRITNGTTTLLQIFQYELNNSFAGYAVHVVRNGSTTLITYSDTGTIIAPDTVYDVHISRTAAGAFKIYVGGVPRKTGTGFTADFTVVAGSGFSFFGAVNHGTRNAVLIDAMTWNRQLSDAEVAAHQADPYSYQVNAGAATITAANGSYSLTGQAAVLRAARVLVAGSGTYTLTGKAAALTYAQPGAFTMSALGGSYALTGKAATLTYVPNAAYSMSAGSGTYSIAGSAALGDYAMRAECGTYSVYGISARLAWSEEPEPAPGSWRRGLQSRRNRRNNGTYTKRQ